MSWPAATPSASSVTRFERFLLRLHDVGQLHVAGLVESQIHGDDGGQVDFDGLESGIDLARHLHLGAVDLDLGGVGSLRSIPDRREHLPGLVGVVVDRLLAEQNEVRVFLLHQG